MMKKVILSTALSLALTAFAGDNTASDTTLKNTQSSQNQTQWQGNAGVAVTALTQVFDALDSSLIDRYYADGYIQHSPQIADGKAGLKAAIDAMQGNVRIEREIARVISEGDLVLVQSRVRFNDGKPRIVADLFRLDNGKIIEHWDSSEDEVPKEKTANGNSMIDGGGDVNKAVTAEQLAANKQTVSDFINKGFANGDKALLDSLFGDEYIQHNPQVPNGKEVVLGFIEKDGEGFPAAVRQIVAQGDLVGVQVEYGEAGGFHNACHDIFRLDDNSKIVEHWDVCTKVPADSEFKHKNGMF